MSSRARGESYLGSKGGAGVWQRIGREVPPCDVLVSAFAGQCALLRLLQPTPPIRIALDRDPDVVAWWQSHFPAVRAIERSALVSLDTLLDRILELPGKSAERVVVYLDPPYLLSTRTDVGSRYRYDLTDEDHQCLLDVARSLPCVVLISGYRSALYDQQLADWRRIDFTAMSRGGPRTECLWSNRPTPAVPHDQRLLGTDRRQREVLARRDRRLTAKVSKMPVAERLRLLAAIASTLPPEVATLPTASVSGPRRGNLEVPSPIPATLEPSVSHRGGDVHLRSEISDLKSPTVLGPQVGVSELPADCSSAGSRRGVVLSLFSGIGLLDLAFRRAGFTVVSAGDLMVGLDVRDCNPQPCVFWGVIGGPPCQQFSRANRGADPRDENGDGFAMLDQFRRVVAAAQPEWWLAENVECVPDIVIPRYSWQRTPVDLTWFIPVRRRRHIQFGSRSGTLIDLTPPSPLPEWPVGSVAECVVAGRRDGRDWREKAKLMGLPEDWDVPCLTRESLAHAIGNGVPLPMGEFLAAAVAAAYGDAADGSLNRSEITRCACPCRRPVSGRRTYFETNCRKIAQMRRERR